jgi:hypothetical protein
MSKRENDVISGGGANSVFAHEAGEAGAAPGPGAGAGSGLRNTRDVARGGAVSDSDLAPGIADAVSDFDEEGQSSARQEGGPTIRSHDLGDEGK